MRMQEHRRKAALVAGCSSLWTSPLPPTFYQRETVILLLISQKNRLRRTQKGHFRLLPL